MERSLFEALIYIYIYIYIVVCFVFYPADCLPGVLLGRGSPQFDQPSDCQEAGLPPCDAKELASQLCSGVEALHILNLIHNDLKPENVMLGNGGHRNVIKICDLGTVTYPNTTN